MSEHQIDLRDRGESASVPGSGDPEGLGAPSLAAACEALLLLADEPLQISALAQATRRPVSEVAAVVAGLAEQYTEDMRGFELRRTGDGWRFYTRMECAEVVERFVLDGQQARLTQAALETLAVIAYKQPVTRARISGIRGVNVDGVVRTLITRGLIDEAGEDPETHAILYKTTSYFLERLGLVSLEQLPPLAEHVPDPGSIGDLVEEGS